jgi:hypothetical protein
VSISQPTSACNIHHQGLETHFKPLDDLVEVGVGCGNLERLEVGGGVKSADSVGLTTGGVVELVPMTDWKLEHQEYSKMFDTVAPVPLHEVFPRNWHV